MEYGKFNTAEELLKGYTELEKSFTQKCQELATLKQDLDAKQNSDVGTNAQSSPQLEQSSSTSGTNGQPSPNVQHAQSVANGEASTVPVQVDADSQVEPSPSAIVPPRVMTGGGNVSMALPNRPKTLAEASELAKKYFN